MFWTELKHTKRWDKKIDKELTEIVLDKLLNVFSYVSDFVVISVFQPFQGWTDGQSIGVIQGRVMWASF